LNSKGGPCLPKQQGKWIRMGTFGLFV
jgi:hypothetical protein